MSTTLALPAPSLADLIPAAELARAAKLAFDTLVSILSDAKATLNERRIAAMAVLRLAGSKRTPSVSERAAAPVEPASPAPRAAPAIPINAAPPLTRHPNHRPARADHLTALAGTAPIAPRTSTTGPKRPVVAPPEPLVPSP